ncbi:MAG: tetratricopeptide repeat protein [Aestuariivirga sp.]
MQAKIIAALAFAASSLYAVPSLAEFGPGSSLSGSYLAGRTAGKERDNDIASSYLRGALKEDAENPVLLERVFSLDLAQGKIAEAEDMAKRVIAFNSQQRMARVVLGLKDFKAGRYGKAREHFTEASYTPVGELTSSLLSAWAYAGDGALNRALKALDKLDANESFANFKNFHAALIADLMGVPIRAEVFYKKAYEQAGTSLRVVQAYGNFLERSGRAKDAEKVYRTFLDGADNNPLVGKALEELLAGKKPERFVTSAKAGAAEALFSLATAMTDEQSIDVAILYTQLALSIEPKSPVYLTLLGDIYEDMQRYEEAIAAYDTIAPASELKSNADIETATNLQRLEKSKDAVTRLDQLLARDASNYDALVTLGNIHRNNEEYAKASEVYSRAIALLKEPQKENWRVFYYRGIAFERQKLWDKAEPDFRKALSLEPDEPLILNYLGYSMIEKKVNLTEALGMVKKAVELKPNDGFIVDSLGWAYYQLGDYEEAVTHLERAVELTPADPIIGEHLGDVYWKVGRKLEAKFQWQHAKDNKPEPDDLKRIEGKLRDGLTEEPAVKPVENAKTPNNG